MDEGTYLSSRAGLYSKRKTVSAITDQQVPWQPLGGLDCSGIFLAASDWCNHYLSPVGGEPCVNSHYRTTSPSPMNLDWVQKTGANC